MKNVGNTKPDVNKKAEEIVKALRAERYTMEYVKQLTYRINKLAAEKARI